MKQMQRRSEPISIFQPGRNCWRVAHASRAALMIDGADYFTNLEDALRRARRSILIVGWDFDGRIRLRPQCDSVSSPPLGPLLHSLVEANPDLEVRILVWSVGVAHAPGEPTQLIFGADWQEHPRLTVRLDTHHPLYGAHHQKMVAIDNSLAFVGGIDLTIERWDTPRHAVDDSNRATPDGNECGPVHDMMVAVDGEAANRIAQLARQRWMAATGEEVAAVGDTSNIWPGDLEPQFTDQIVAVARTLPPMGDQVGVAESARLAVDMMANARHAIYLEQQYMTARPYGDVLVRQLQREDGPEVVVVMTHHSHGALEEWVMGRNRDRMIRRLRRADRYGRLRAYYPCVPNATGERRQVLIHSKLIIVDDRFLRIGSSNLNNRSMGLDSECDLAIEAQDKETSAGVISIRNRLLAEHLDTAPDTVAAAIEQEKSLVCAIDALNVKSRGLQPFDAMHDRGGTRQVWGTRLLDPRKPFEPLWFLRRRGQKRRYRQPGVPAG